MGASALPTTLVVVGCVGMKQGSGVLQLASGVHRAVSMAKHAANAAHTGPPDSTRTHAHTCVSKPAGSSWTAPATLA